MYDILIYYGTIFFQQDAKSVFGTGTLCCFRIFCFMIVYTTCFCVYYKPVRNAMVVFVSILFSLFLVMPNYSQSSSFSKNVGLILNLRS